jgi:alpha-glucosidase
MTSNRSALIIPALIIILLAAEPRPAAAAKPLSVSSPDGSLVVSFALKSNPQPYLPGERAYYQLVYKDQTVLNDSPMGLDFFGARALDRDFEIAGTDKRTADSTWENPFGPRRVVADRYNEMTVSLREKRPPGRRMDIVFRVYNEGLAFRYVLPKQRALDKFALSSESTGFYFAHGGYAYALNMGRFNTHNEGEYLPVRLDEIKPAAVINLPFLVETPGGPWVAVLEADLTNYAGMYLSGVSGFPYGLAVKLSIPPRKESVARSITTAQNQALEQPVTAATPKTTPWRVVMAAPTPGRLIENNDLILNLNPPCAIADPSWIKPGKAAWDWWSGSFAKNVPFTPGMNTATMMHYIDFAGTHHIEYMLVDGGWYAGTGDPASDDIRKSIPGIDIPAILAHAKSKNVKVLLWVEWRPLDRLLDEALSLYEKWGVAGIKVDYMNRDDQEMVNLCAKWVRKAAEHHLVIDLHGASKETGLRRTYPNLLTVEGVMGMEYNKWSERVTPEYDVTIPFTRMLAGPMDFTPGAFRNAARGKFQIRDVEPMSQGTRAHQLAMYVVYDAPLVMLADYPEAYEGQPGLEFIEKVPTVWDETKVLSGSPGKSIVTARRKGDLWYLGAMTSWEARDLTIPLDFLGSNVYEVRIFADGPDADSEGTSLNVETKRLKTGDTLGAHLAPGGGLAVILAPVRK